MNLHLRDLVRQSILAPRQAARRLIEAAPGLAVGWMVLGLGVVTSALVAAVTLALVPVPPDPAQPAPGPITPFGIVLLQGTAQLILVLAGHRIGRVFGGRARFADVLLLIGWLELLMVGVSLLELLLLLILPDLSGVLPWLVLPLVLWILASFLAEAHGFASTPLVLLGLVGAGFALAFAAAVLTLALGFGAGG